MLRRILSVLACALLQLTVFIRVAFADEALVFGPVTATRTTATPETRTYRFEMPANFAPPYRLAVVNGNDANRNRASSGLITVNGQRVLGTSELNQQVGQVEKKVALSRSNSLLVELTSAPGSTFSIRVYGQRLSSAAPSNLV